MENRTILVRIVGAGIDVIDEASGTSAVPLQAFIDDQRRVSDLVDPVELIDDVRSATIEIQGA
jgi:hypothetical protein